MVKVKALRNCRFDYAGTMYHFSDGEEREIDVPIDKLDNKSFEVLEESVKKEIKIRRKKDIEEEVS